MHEDLDTGEVIIHGPALTDPDDIARLRHLGESEVPIVVPRELLVDFGPKEVTPVPNIIGLDEFDRLFTRFEHTAWRLETPRRYASDEVTGTYAQFLRGEPVDGEGKDAEWCAERCEQTTLGKRFERVRVVDNPPTPGSATCSTTPAATAPSARTSGSSGAPTPNASTSPKRTSGSSTRGWWPRLSFDDADDLVSVALITEPVEVNRYAQVRDAAWHYAVPYETFAANLPAQQSQTRERNQ